MNPNEPIPALPIAVLISGGGRTLANLIECIQAGSLSADVRLVISSSANAGGLQHAQRANVRSEVLERRTFDSTAEYSQAIFNACRSAGAELVVMGGFLKHVLIPDEWTGRVVNIHPSLLPSFGGKGFYGQRVHQAVLDTGCRYTGCTIHFVDNHYDQGPIIEQVVVPVEYDDTADALAARVFVEECRAYPRVIQAIAEGRVSLQGRKVRIEPPCSS